MIKGLFVFLVGTTGVCSVECFCCLEISIGLDRVIVAVAMNL